MELVLLAAVLAATVLGFVVARAIKRKPSAQAPPAKPKPAKSAAPKAAPPPPAKKPGKAKPQPVPLSGELTPDRLRAIIEAERAKRGAHHLAMFRAEFKPACARLLQLRPESCARVLGGDIETAINELYQDVGKQEFATPAEKARAFADVGEIALGVERGIAQAAFEAASNAAPADFWVHDGLLRAYAELGDWTLTDAPAADAFAAARNDEKMLIALIDAALMYARGDRFDELTGAIEEIEEILDRPGLTAPRALAETAAMLAEAFAVLSRRVRETGAGNEDACRNFFNDAKTWINQRAQS